jgi:hypothetical protein
MVGGAGECGVIQKGEKGAGKFIDGEGGQFREGEGAGQFIDGGRRRDNFEKGQVGGAI